MPGQAFVTRGGLSLFVTPGIATPLLPAPTPLLINPATATSTVSSGAAIAFAYRQGPAGPVGPQGPSGNNTGFGQVRYAEAAGSSPLNISAFTRTQLTFRIDPTQTQASLNPPFAGVLAFDGAVITPRKLNDAMFVLVNLLVTAAVAGGAVRFDIDVGSSAGPTGSATESLLNPAGQPERVTGILYVQTLANFMANGARLFLTSSVPIAVVSAAVVLIPQSTHTTS